MNRLFKRKPSLPSDGSAASSAAAAAASASSASPAAATAAPSSSFGPPGQLSSDPIYVDAIALLNAASRSEDAGELRAAAQQYESGLALLLSLLKSLPSEAAKSRDFVRGLMSGQMSQAERLKERISGGGTHAAHGSNANGHRVMPLTRSQSGPHGQGQHQHASASSALRPASSSVSPVGTATSSSSPPASHIDPSLRAAIESEILVPNSRGVSFASVVGLEDAKDALREMVILPSLRPDLFSGIRAPPRGLLLYGPPGNGKSLLGAAVAAESGCTFFSISAASLVSKHLGEGERLVRALFSIARERSPAIIFIDEVDSIMGRRGGDTEHEASRRLKTEMLIQMDGCSAVAAAAQPRVCVLAATNCPEDLDEALIRRLPRRVFIGCPTPPARQALLSSMLSQPGLRHTLTPKQLASLVDATDGYSNSDLTALCRDAALAPVRALPQAALLKLSEEQLPPVTLAHFTEAMRRVRPSVSKERLAAYKKWNEQQEAAR